MEKKEERPRSHSIFHGAFFSQSDNLDIGGARFPWLFDGLQIHNVLSGLLDDVNILVFGFIHPGGGMYGHPTEITVALISSESVYLPDFDFQPEGVEDKIKSAFAYQDIDFESHPQFSSSYLLRGEAEYAIRRVFTDEVLTFFSDNPGLYVEARGNKLVETG